MTDTATPSKEPWAEEVFAGHRWGRQNGRAAEEYARLRALWQAAQPFDEASTAIMDQIIALEVCNWRLEESILALCGAIGAKKPVERGIGHMASIGDERWRRVWAYYLTLRDWLPCGVVLATQEKRSGYRTLLRMCDPDGAIQRHVVSLLGESDELKQLCVERFCLCLEFWLGGFYAKDSVQMRSLDAAIKVVEAEIRSRDPGSEGFLGAMDMVGGKLELCHHKLFRRYDIILSSIGAGAWRAAMPRKGSDGFERAAVLEPYLSGIEAWREGSIPKPSGEQGQLAAKIGTLLGGPDATKVFLASLLVSLLRSQQVRARRIAEERTRKS